ncbi:MULTISPECIES: hypothetical protein [unclassified Kitasatospora]|uniref:hypothetical protein n=1 Tax=unclassified Kitasatospora TaxID=2633591 RepID=UPI00070DC866|nr:MULTISPECIES: hypothetical protein [unclassified Kitasatospora]KQV11992.1 hypothetical protein ASC99_35545 [Kitasatospora sp. Root107]KRB68867.1 hypothetical protein ASE03_28615 [Kitasatospora sp. Root187]
MTEPINPGSHVVEVELQIDQVIIMGPAEATATVRCTLGPVRCGARFDRIRDSADAIDLELTQILAYLRHPVEELDPVHTALVSLRGTGVRLLTSVAPGSRWQVIRGTNPPS